MKGKTVRDAFQCTRGLGGALIYSMPKHNDSRALFAVKAENLARQIAADNGVEFETGDVPDETPLSDEAVRLLEELETLKRSILGNRLLRQ